MVSSSATTGLPVQLPGEAIDPDADVMDYPPFAANNEQFRVQMNVWAPRVQESLLHLDRRQNEATNTLNLNLGVVRSEMDSIIQGAIDELNRIVAAAQTELTVVKECVSIVVAQLNHRRGETQQQLNTTISEADALFIQQRADLA